MTHARLHLAILVLLVCIRTMASCCGAPPPPPEPCSAPLCPAGAFNECEPGVELKTCCSSVGDPLQACWVPAGFLTSECEGCSGIGMCAVSDGVVTCDAFGQQ